MILGQGSAREMMQRRKGGAQAAGNSEKLRYDGFFFKTNEIFKQTLKHLYF